MNLLDGLNEQQKKSVLYNEGPLLLLAGAGSGKTRVLTHKIAYLVENGVEPYNILAITFTNKAAREMKERTKNLVARGNEVWISTFHSMCVQILRQFIEKIGYEKTFTILDSHDSEALIKSCLKEMNIDEKTFKPKSILSAISANKNELLSPSDYFKTISENDFRQNKIAQIYEKYQAKLIKSNALDFDDIIFLTIKLFQVHSDVLEKYQERFKYIMIDEYQDTNTAQYTLIKLLSGRNKNICVVGDDDQSIYGWRGANVYNILGFEKDFPNAKVVKLEQNYRSTKNILETANAVIKNNLNRKSKQLWTSNDDGSKIKCFVARTGLSEADYVVDLILSKVQSGEYSYKDFAILYRNNFQSRTIEDKCVKKDVPYRLLGGTRFYERKEIKDLICYLRVVCNPNDDIALRRIINTPKRGIGDTTIEKFLSHATQNKMSLWESLNENVSSVRSVKINEFIKMIDELVKFSNDNSMEQLLKKILELTNYKTYLQNEDEIKFQGKLENVEELISKIIEFETTSVNDKSLANFLEQIALVSDVDNFDENDDAVVLMTLHSSKGLEFPFVFIIGMEENIFPSQRSISSLKESELEEERRLCYVGITRAEKELCLTCARSRIQNGEERYNSQSRFIDELPKKLINFENELPKEINSIPYSKISAVSKELNDIKIKRFMTYDLPAPENIKLDFNVGDKVFQQRYGIGIVKEIKPAGADFQVTVDFPKLGEKIFMAGLAKIKKMN